MVCHVSSSIRRLHIGHLHGPCIIVARKPQLKALDSTSAVEPLPESIWVDPEWNNYHGERTWSFRWSYIKASTILW
jgi:hypothetical protein